jgi:hypothetical protein
MSDKKKTALPPTPPELAAMAASMAVETVDSLLAEWEAPSDQRFWAQAFLLHSSPEPEACAKFADASLAEYRKRFPLDDPKPNLKGRNPSEEDEDEDGG